MHPCLQLTLELGRAHAIRDSSSTWRPDENQRQYHCRGSPTQVHQSLLFASQYKARHLR